MNGKKIIGILLYSCFAIFGLSLAFTIVFPGSIIQSSEDNLILLSLGTALFGIASVIHVSSHAAKNGYAKDESNRENQSEYYGNNTKAMRARLMGVNLKSPSGLSMQSTIKLIEVGDVVSLALGEYDNKPSVRVDTYYGPIGYLSKQMAYVVEDILRQGILEKAVVYAIHGGRFGVSFSVDILILVKEKVRTTLDR